MQDEQWPPSDDGISREADGLIESENRAVQRAEDVEEARTRKAPEADDG